VRALLVRALVAFVALPGVVAFLVPWAVIASDRSASVVTLNGWGAVPFALGTGLLLACVREFYVAGHGTLAPWSPPVALVVSGPYRWSRNPMYVAVLLVLAGWAIGFRSATLGIYAGAVLVAFQLRIVLHEEPWLARTFGNDWVPYRERVRRWL
jgi:protein-S-isoprenylcysteine O-methyltransferase Ste14